jgi:hypothetical protein
MRGRRRRRIYSYSIVYVCAYIFENVTADQGQDKKASDVTRCVKLVV